MAVDIFGHTHITTKPQIRGGVGGGAFLRLDGSSKLTGDIDLDSHKIVNLANPTDPHDAVTMKYARDMSTCDVYTIIPDYMRALMIRTPNITLKSALRHSSLLETPSGNTTAIRLFDNDAEIYQLTFFTMHNEENGESTKPFVIMVSTIDHNYERRIDALGPNAQYECSVIIDLPDLPNDNRTEFIRVNIRNDASTGVNLNVKLYLVLKRLV